MVTPVVMPQMGLEVTEAVVVAVLVARGQQVTESEALVELETDKAVTEVVAPRDGYVLAIDVTEGATIAVGAVVARLGDAADEPLDDAPSDPATVRSVPAALRRAAPVARRMASELGIDIATLTGTGPRGRITVGDVQAAANGDGDAGTPTATVPTAQPDDELVDLTPLRRAIARRLSASQLIPQYQLERDVDASHLLAQKGARAAAVGGGEQPSVGVNDLLVQAIAETVVRHPDLAAAFVDGVDGGHPRLRRRPRADVGLAVATDAGLLVPVIRNADRLGLAEIARERVRLVAAARGGTLPLDDMSGGVITLSNLAGFGVDRFTAMLNPGESAIVAIGRVTERLVTRGRAILTVPTLTLTLSFDHRVVDGAVGAAAMAELADLLEGAMAWRP